MEFNAESALSDALSALSDSEDAVSEDASSAETATVEDGCDESDCPASAPQPARDRAVRDMVNSIAVNCFLFMFMVTSRLFFMHTGIQMKMSAKADGHPKYIIAQILTGELANL